MPAILIRLRVSDFLSWQHVFGEQEFARTANGCQSAQIFHNADDPTELVIVLTWDDLLRARLFSQSDDLYESIRHPSALDYPDIWLLEAIPPDPDGCPTE